MNELLKLIERNDCDVNEFSELVHRTLLLFILEEVCQKLKSDKKLKERTQSEFRKTTNNARVSLKLVKDICGTQLDDEDAKLIATWIQAFFKKKSVRNPISFATRTQLLEKQNYKCACCKKQLGIEESHVDHIIPWDYVGDELGNNYQVLCSYCNEHKSNNVHYLLKRQIIKKNN